MNEIENNIIPQPDNNLLEQNRLNKLAIKRAAAAKARAAKKTKQEEFDRLKMIEEKYKSAKSELSNIAANSNIAKIFKPRPVDNKIPEKFKVNNIMPKSDDTLTTFLMMGGVAAAVYFGSKTFGKKKPDEKPDDKKKDCPNQEFSNNAEASIIYYPVQGYSNNLNPSEMGFPDLLNL